MPTDTTTDRHPALSDGVVNFLESELRDFRENCRNGNIDAADGSHPTLAWAVNSLEQAPDDVIRGWLCEDEESDGELVLELLNLLVLVCDLGPDAKLVDLV